MENKSWLQTKILGIKVDFVGLKEAIEWVEDRVKYNKRGQIVTPNPEQAILAQKDKEFFRVLNKAELSICDGVGLLWAAKLLSLCSPAAILMSPSESNSRKNSDTKKKVIGGRIVKAHKIGQARREFTKLSGTDLMIALCRKAAQKGWRVFLLGGREGVAEEAAKTLNIPVGFQPSGIPFRPTPAGTKYSILNFNIKYSSGAADITNESIREKEETIKQINQFRPHLLFVAYGAPYQEKWIAKNLPTLKVNVTMGVGGAFDYLSGKVSRAPKLVRSLGLEWLWRLIDEPWRIRRQLRLIEFGWLLISERLRKTQ